MHRLADPAPRTLPHARAERAGWAASALLHGAALAGLCGLVHSRALAPPPASPGIPVIFAPAPAEAAQAAPVLLPEAGLQAAAPALEPQALAVPRPRHLAHPLAIAETRDAAPRAVARPKLVVPARASSDAAAPNAPAASPGAAPSAAAPAGAPADAPAGALAAFAARVHQAVQQALVYPGTARLMREQGAAQVRFALAEGGVGPAAIAATSQFPALDRAALDAVRRAAIPQPPPELARRRLSMVISVDFRLASD